MSKISKCVLRHYYQFSMPKFRVVFRLLLRLYLQLRTDLVSTHAVISGNMISYCPLKHEEAKMSQPLSILCSLLCPSFSYSAFRKEFCSTPSDGKGQVTARKQQNSNCCPQDGSTHLSSHCCQHAPAKQDDMSLAGILTGCASSCEAGRTVSNPGPNSDTRLVGWPSADCLELN